MRDRWKQIKTEGKVMREREREENEKRRYRTSNKAHEEKGYKQRVRDSLVGNLLITPRAAGRHACMCAGNGRARGTGVDLLPSPSLLFSADLGNYSFPLEETNLRTNLIFGYIQ